MAFETKVVEEHGVSIVTLSGELDSKTSPEFEKTLLKLVAEKKQEILLDLTQLAYVASAGLRIFVMVGKRLQAEGGRLALCAVNANVMKVLEISGFVSLFPIRPHREEAIPWLHANARVAKITSLAGDILRKELGGSPTPRPAGPADHERSAYAAELLRKKDPR